MKIILLKLLVFCLLITTVCCSACDHIPFTLKTGTYGFEKAIITNKLTNETIEKNLDEIFTDNTALTEWGNITGFQIYINENTEYFRKKNNRYYVINEGLAFEIIEDDLLCLHFPFWRGYDYNLYDLKIILCLQQMYA